DRVVQVVALAGQVARRRAVIRALTLITFPATAHVDLGGVLAVVDHSVDLRGRRGLLDRGRRYELERRLGRRLSRIRGRLDRVVVVALVAALVGGRKRVVGVGHL